MSLTRVYVTGLGPICSMGRDWKTLWRNLLEGRTRVAPVDRLAGAPVAFGAEVNDFHAEGILTPQEGRLDRMTHFAIVAAHRALEDSGLLSSNPKSVIPNPQSLGVVLGSSRGAAEMFEASHRRFIERGADGVGPRVSPHTTAGNLSGAVARHFGLRGPCLTVSAACASATQAIGMGLDLIRSGRAEVVLAGGAEACLTPFCMSMFAATGILSRRSDSPSTACRPFDLDRDGIVIGEGAGVVILESESHARARGAQADCELRGYGATCDAHSLTGIAPGGEGLVRAIRAALADAGAAPEDVDFVSAHGTGTIEGDRTETEALKTALGAHARRTAVSSTKSMTGHLIGASGGIEAIVCALAIREGAAPPTINRTTPDPSCDLDLVTGTARQMRIRLAISNSMGFGGNNACLVFGA